MILISPNNATRIEGQNVTFECNLEGQPLSIVTWWKGSTQIVTSDSRFHVSGAAPRSVDNSTVTLTITNVTRNDEGFYQCRAENQLGSHSSKGAYLIVDCKLIVSVLFVCLF